MSAAWTAYRMLTPVLGALAPAAKAFMPAAERPHWGERLGRLETAGACEAWVHAASMGEAAAVTALLPELTRVAPAARLHLSATTVTGRQRLDALGHPVSLAPLDYPDATSRFLATVRPARMILVETEVWPNWLLGARRAEVPVAVVSAKLSARSLARLRRLGAPLRALIRGLAAVLTQTQADRERWVGLGADPARTEVVGNLKSDALPQPAAPRKEVRERLQLDPERRLLVLGSVRPGEAAIVATAWRALEAASRRGWQVVAVPRHAGAADRIRAEAGDVDWRWDARAGVLNDYYAAADAAFVGASLVPIGGHNPLEPAAFGAAIVMGPHHGAQADAVARLRQAGAIAVTDGAAELQTVLSGWLADPSGCERIGSRGREVVDRMRGAARRAVERLGFHHVWPVT